MSDSRSLAIQSVLYGNSSIDIQRSAEAVAASVAFAAEKETVGRWRYLLGDCSPEPVLSDDDREVIDSLVRGAGGEFSYLIFGENLGHGGGHNRLAEGGDEDVLLFLNPDSRVAPDTVFSLLEGLRDGVGALDGRQLPLDHPKDYDQATGETSWASGACLMTPRRVFEHIDGFDHATFFLYCDDVDYSWRASLAGYLVCHAPSARVFHDKRLIITGGIEAGSAEIYYSAEAALLLAHKYSRPQRVKEILRQFDRADGDDVVKRAASEYRRRQSQGELPAAIDGQNRVGQFVKGNYAVHRY